MWFPKTHPSPSGGRVSLRKPHPAARNHRVSFQQLERAGRAHFRRDHARHVFFERDVVNHGEARITLDDPQTATEHLPLFPLPMKADSDGHVIKRECARCGTFRYQRDFRSELMPAWIE